MAISSICSELVTRFFNVHCHHKPRNPQEFVCRNAFHSLHEKSIADLRYPVSVGIHPWHTAAFSPKLMDKFRTLALLPQVLAIGEAGFDKRHGPDLRSQMRCFQAQFELAQEVRLPLVVHCVRAWQEIWPFLQRTSVPVLLHDFRGNQQVLNSLLPFSKVFFSFGQSLMQSPKAAAIFCLVPPGRRLTETDQTSISIEAVYKQAAFLLRQDGEEFAVQMKKNCRAFFGEKSLPFF